MPIAELGYRHWEGKRTGAMRRWLAITRSEVTIAWGGSRLLRRFLFFTWLPILYFTPVFLAIGYAADPSNSLEDGVMFTEIAREIFPSDVIQRLRDDPGAFLPGIWSVAFYIFFAWCQSFFAMIVVAIAGPPLIARDRRSKAFLIYFSKPIEAWQYLLGKLATVVFFVLVMSLLPAVLLYAISIALAPDSTTLLATLPVLFEIAIASLVTAIPVGMVVLLISSLTRDRRIATFAWVILCLFGEIAYRILSVSSRMAGDEEPPVWAALFSLREVTMRAASGVFHVRERVEQLFAGLGTQGRGMNSTSIPEIVSGGLTPGGAFLALGTLTVACGVLIMWRAKKAVRI